MVRELERESNTMMREGRNRAKFATMLLAISLWLLLIPSACATKATTAPMTQAASGPVTPPPVTQPAIEPKGTAVTQPVEATSQETPSPVPPATMKVLKALEQAGVKYQTVRSDIEMTVLLPALGDSEQRSGWVAYQRGPGEESEKIRVHFETLKLGAGPNTRQREDYAFDGQWAVEAKHSVKQLTRWQVAAPGERVQALRIGKGAFPPLPFGQKAQEVLEYYQATLRPAEKTDPPDSDHLELVARRDRRKELDFDHLDLWVSRASGLPVKVVGTDKDKNIKTVSLTNTQTNVKFSDDLFDLKPGFGWTVNTQPLPERNRQEESP